MTEHEKFDFRSYFSGSEEVVTKKAGEEVVIIGKPGSTMYVLKSGTVHIHLFDGKHTAVLESGELIGLMGLIDGRDYEDTTIAATDCELIPVDIKTAKFMFQNHPTFALNLLQVVIDRFYYVMDLAREKYNCGDAVDA